MRRALVLALVAAVLPTQPARPAHFDLIQPVPGPIIRHFEPPPTPYSPGHRGLDFAAEAGTTVRAAADGVVAFAGQVGGDLFVSIDHAGGLRTTYGFLGGIWTAAGRVVAQGEPIASSGNGHDGAAEPHLHFGLRRASEYLDPEPFLLESIRRNTWRVVSLAS